MQIKQPGPKSLELKQVPLDLYYSESVEARLPDAYERLLLDVIEGNSTLFMDREEVELAWKNGAMVCSMLGRMIACQCLVILRELGAQMKQIH